MPDPVVDWQGPSDNFDLPTWDTDIPWRNDRSFHNCNMDNCDPRTLEHCHQEHWSVENLGRL